MQELVEMSGMEANVVRGPRRAVVWGRVSVGPTEAESRVNPSFPREAWNWREATLPPTPPGRIHYDFGGSSRVSVSVPFCAEGREGSSGDPHTQPISQPFTRWTLPTLTALAGAGVTKVAYQGEG